VAYLFFVRPNARSTVHSLHQTSVGRTQGKFRRRAKASSKRKYERLLLAAVQELLQQDPDVSVAEAQLALDGQRGKFQRKRNVSDRKRERGHHANVFLQSVLQRAKRKA